MSMVHVLPEAIANKIAAGEVIERPSSIVKELLENSLDAGATSVEIEINHGGRSLIRIADNGCGMNAEDAELSFRRHATSKISNEDDLNAIASFGFRGEALSSIAAVSRVLMVTRPESEPHATEIRIEGGKSMGVKSCPASPGTVIEVRDLFFNTPARRKFLRTDSTELGHIQDAVAQAALSNPNLRLVFKSNGRTMLDISPTDDLKQRVEAVLGEETSKQLLRIDDEGEDLRIYGFVGKPFAARGNRAGQIFFVNRRWIKSIGLSHALQAGFHGLLMHGQYPLGVIFIEVDPERVDVNVHPTKQEVRLANEREIKSLLKRAVSEALREEEDISPDLKDFRENVPAGPSMGQNLDLSFQDAAKRDPVSLYAAELNSEREGGAGVSSSQVAHENVREVYMGAVREENLPAPIEIRNRLKITKILGQIHGTFIVAETEDGLMILDQHAAHEKVMFEALARNFEKGEPAKQSLLMDEVIELHPRQVEVMQQALPLLNRLGFELEEFGENAFVLRSYPAILEKQNPVQFLKHFIEEKEDGKVSTSLENYREDIAALIACKKSSVKAHEPLTPLQLQALVERLAACENPFSCPHGRPAFFKKTFLELERQFKRK